MAKILVTGGAGFIGSHVVDLLINNNHKVAIVDNLVTGSKKNLNPKAIFYEQDITDESLLHIFEKEKPEIVVHIAAQINLRDSMEKPLFDAKSNILGTINLLECCKKTGVKKVVYSSSGGAAYGDPERIPCDETHPIKPICHYGASKLSAELYFHVYKIMYGIEYTILRYANVYGPRQDPKGEAGVISIFLGCIEREKVPVIFGDGTQTRDFVYVGDVAQADLLAVQKSALNLAVNIGTGKETSVNKVFAAIKTSTGTSINAKHGDKIPGEVYKIALDVSRAKKLLGWTSKVTLQEGIQKTADWFKSRND